VGPSDFTATTFKNCFRSDPVTECKRAEILGLYPKMEARTEPEVDIRPYYKSEKLESYGLPGLSF